MRDGMYLNRELQDHGDDAFPTAGEVEPFRKPDSEAPQKQWWDGMRWGETQHTTPGLRHHLDAHFPAAIQADLSAGGPAQTTGPSGAEGPIRTRGQNHQVVRKGGG